MPYNQPFLSIAWGGPIGPKARADTWSGSLKMGQQGNWSAGELPPVKLEDWDSQLRAELVSAFEQFIPAPGLRLRTDARVEWIKVNRIGTDGRYTLNDRTNEIPVNLQGKTLPTYPQQVALASTYRTEARRGRGARGRTYWPTAATYSFEGGAPTGTQCQEMASTVAGFLSQLSTVFRTAGFALDPCVMSQLGGGTTMRIIQVDVGSRFDIQKRRDNSEDEVYHPAPVPGLVPLPTGPTP